MDNEKLLKITVIALPILIIIILVVIYSATKNKISQSPELTDNLFCTNRDNTATVCKRDIICQCYSNNSSKFFFANKDEECPADCSILKPASPEGDLGTCNIALIMANDIPLCHASCKGKDISLKAREIKNDCCQITLERPCSQV